MFLGTSATRKLSPGFRHVAQTRITARITKSNSEGKVVIDLEKNDTIAVSQYKEPSLDPTKLPANPPSLHTAISPSLTRSDNLSARLRAGQVVKDTDLFLYHEHAPQSYLTASTGQKRRREHNELEETSRDTYYNSVELGELGLDDTFNAPSNVSNNNESCIVDLVDESGKETDDELQFIGSRTLKERKKPVPIPKILHRSRQAVSVAYHQGLRLSCGQTIELKDGAFMKLHTMYKDQKERYILIGPIFTRANTLGLVMPSKRDSMVWKVDSSSGEYDTRLPLYFEGSKLINEVIQKVRTVKRENKRDFGLWMRPIGDVLRLRELRVTNQPYTNTNCVTSALASHIGMREAIIRETGVLVCRWRDVIVHDEYGKWQEQRIERPYQNNIDEEWLSSPELLSKIWRPGTATKAPNAAYTFCDSFCGAGGVSAGADQAGLKVSISFDIDEQKIATFRVNHPDCKSLVMGVSEFIQLAQRRKWRVDILHLSPPCQPFSQANTRPNEAKNEVNQLPLLACADVVKCLRPRIVTVEETPGIENRHHAWFRALLHQFTELGFSLRWGQLRCSDFGVPQLRRRLFIIASAPGEDLPPFPIPTHGPDSVSIWTALNSVRVASRTTLLTHHDPQRVYSPPKPRYDPHCLAKTITTGGGESYHPSGLRPFTPRELAVLQTFSVWYRFGRTRDGREFTVTELRKQIGNAVPPLVAKALFESIIKSLRNSDRRRMENERDEDVVYVG